MKRTVQISVPCCERCDRTALSEILLVDAGGRHLCHGCLVAEERAAATERIVAGDFGGPEWLRRLKADATAKVLAERQAVAS